jgi:hypothetical protein
MFIFKPFIFLASVIFIIVGFFICGAIVYDLKQSDTTKDWLSTKGTIISPDLTYTYLVAGKKYIDKSTDISTLHIINNTNIKLDNQKNYKVGQSVDVYYNPNNFSQSSLTKTIPNLYIKSAIGITLLIFGFLLL